jgi:hypothetical protein
MEWTRQTSRCRVCGRIIGGFHVGLCLRCTWRARHPPVGVLKRIKSALWVLFGFALRAVTVIIIGALLYAWVKHGGGNRWED